MSHYWKRTRTYPIPKVGDRIWIQARGGNEIYETVVDSIVEDRDFTAQTPMGIVQRGFTEPPFKHGFAWGWIDPEVEAKRLRQAAKRLLKKH